MLEEGVRDHPHESVFENVTDIGSGTLELGLTTLGDRHQQLVARTTA
jgi:hypothetical protein